MKINVLVWDNYTVYSSMDIFRSISHFEVVSLSPVPWQRIKITLFADFSTGITRGRPGGIKKTEVPQALISK